MAAEKPWLSKEAQQFQERTLSRVEGFSPADFWGEAVRLDEEQRALLEGECINLYPGTNVLTPRVAGLLGSTVASRAAEGHPGAKYQTGLSHVEEAEVMATELVCRLFDSGYAEVRALSGSMANMAVLNSLTEPGDAVFSFSAPAGGHISHNSIGVAGYRRLEVHPIPYDVENWAIDLEALRRAVRSRPPRLIILGGSLILFQYPVREVREIADEVGALLMYDAAHVAGLVAGGVWQHPLKEGAHVMTASTYKSFGGPPGGIVITDDPELARGVDRAVFPGMTANFHTNRMPALLAATADLLEFGRDYARACHLNARALAEALHEEGLTVAGYEQGSTHGHMLALDVGQGRARATARALEAANLICNMNLLPGDPLRAVRNPSGLRLGVQEVTRWGMGQTEMCRIAEWFRRIVLEEEPPRRVQPEVSTLKQQFCHLRYAFV